MQLLPLIALSAALAASGYAPQHEGSEPLAPELEARVQKLGKELRCAVCQGLSIWDSPSSMARAQLDKVRELVAQGQSDEAIQGYFIQRYGEWVLLRPTWNGWNVLVWAGPVGLVLLGLFLVSRQLQSRSRATAG